MPRYLRLGSVVQSDKLWVSFSGESLQAFRLKFGNVKDFNSRDKKWNLKDNKK